MTIKPILQTDTLPENHNFSDKGCNLHNSCLNCPLLSCVYDEPNGRINYIRRQRDTEILHRFRRGETLEKLASHFEISRRTIQRVLKNSIVELRQK
jgi:hypothetical protein